VLTNTFIHIPGIGAATEARLWAEGLLTWRDFLQAPCVPPFSTAKRDHVRSYLLESERAFKEREHGFFSRLLASREQWRTFPEFADSIAYLDIETTGLGSGDEVTVVGVYDGANYRAYINGLDLEEFPEDIAGCSLLVTYSGTCFDLPFLRRFFRGLQFDQLHIDLCYLLRRLGYSGGLKRVEERLGIERSRETQGLDGYDAVRLWREYEAGRRRSLDLLVRYNMEDVTNLEHLLTFAYGRMRKKTGFRASG
jgi:uncharacterized protein YprB with RNaseH-like and TPR domain